MICKTLLTSACRDISGSKALWQTNDRLQLKAQVCFDGGKTYAYSSFSAYGLIGFNWMIR